MGHKFTPFAERHKHLLKWYLLCTNPLAIGELKRNAAMVVPGLLSKNANPEAVEWLFAKFPEAVVWRELSANPAAIGHLWGNRERINWSLFSSNPAAMPLLRKRPLDSIELPNLCSNESLDAVNFCGYSMRHPGFWMHTFADNANPRVLPFLYADGMQYASVAHRADAIDDVLQLEGLWDRSRTYPISSKLSRNRSPKAVSFLRANPRYINWNEMSYNPSATALLAERLDDALAMDPLIDYAHIPHEKAVQRAAAKAIWSRTLSGNPCAIGVLEQHPNRIDWYNLTTNPAIFQYDYAQMQKDNEAFRRELLACCMHPKNAKKLEGWGLA